MTCPGVGDVAAYVLGALEPEERERVAAHLRGCTECTRTLTELGGLPRLLAAVTPGDLRAEAPELSELAFQRLRRSIDGARPRRRLDRWLVAVAAAVAVVAGGLGTGVVMSPRAPEPTTVQASSGDVHAWATIVADRSGSSITLSMHGIPRGATCWLVAVGRDGEQVRTRSWTVDDDGDAYWSGVVSLAPEQLSRLRVVASDGRTIVTMNA